MVRGSRVYSAGVSVALSGGRATQLGERRESVVLPAHARSSPPGGPPPPNSAAVPFERTAWPIRPCGDHLQPCGVPLERTDASRRAPLTADESPVGSRCPLQEGAEAQWNSGGGDRGACQRDSSTRSGPGRGTRAGLTSHARDRIHMPTTTTQDEREGAHKRSGPGCSHASSSTSDPTVDDRAGCSPASTEAERRPRPRPASGSRGRRHQPASSGGCCRRLAQPHPGHRDWRTPATAGGPRPCERRHGHGPQSQAVPQ